VVIVSFRQDVVPQKALSERIPQGSGAESGRNSRPDLF
jgi:hypothetical protein